MDSSTADALKVMTRDFETQSLTAVVAGFSFAAALSWMDLVRWLLSQVVKGKSNSGISLGATAVVTTILSVVIFNLVSMARPRIQKSQPVFAVTR